jgi:hypothetical protein
MTAIGLIGCGGMAQDVVAALRGADTADGVRIVGALARPGRGDEARAKLCGVDIGAPRDARVAGNPKRGPIFQRPVVMGSRVRGNDRPIKRN